MTVKNFNHNRNLFFGKGKNKRGQITVFIIIAVILLFSTALILYIRNNSTDVTPNIEVLEQVPSEAVPVKEFIESCMKDAIDDALVLVGSQGGYVNLDNFDTITPTIDSLNSDVLSVDYGLRFMPYWFYQKRSGIDELRIPESRQMSPGDGSIPDQLNIFIKQNVLVCIEQFKKFSEAGTAVTPTSELIVTSQINEDDVSVLVTYPLTIRTLGTEVEVTKFFVKVPVRLGKILRLAEEIASFEQQEAFLERATIKFVSLYSGIDDRMLPPPAGGLDFVPCSDKVFWIAQDVEENFKTMLGANIPYVKIGNTDHDRIIITSDLEPDESDREIRQAVFDNLIFDTGSLNSYRDIRADLIYSSDMGLELNLGSRGIIEPSSKELNLMTSRYCMYDYSFYYDIKYPVRIRLVDSRSYIDSEPYVFEFPMMTVIKDNFPRIRYSDLTDLSFDDEAIPSFECDSEQFDSGIVNFSVLDRKTKEPLPKAVVNFQCGPDKAYAFDDEGNLTFMADFSENCMLGATSNKGVLQTRLRSCYGGGFVTISKNGYLEKFDLVGTITDNQNYSFEYNLTPLVTKKFKVMKYFVKPPIKHDPDPDLVFAGNGRITQCRIDDEYRSMAGNEDVFIRIEKLDPENGYFNGVPSLIYNSRNDDSNLTIAPGQYLIELTTYRTEQYAGEQTIRRHSSCVTIPGDWFHSDRTECYPDEDVLLPQTATGGSTFVWDVGEEIYDNNEIAFFVIDEGKPSTVEQIGQPLDHTQDCSSLNPEKILPRYLPVTS